MASLIARNAFIKELASGYSQFISDGLYNQKETAGKSLKVRSKREHQVRKKLFVETQNGFLMKELCDEMQKNVPSRPIYLRIYVSLRQKQVRKNV